MQSNRSSFIDLKSILNFNVRLSTTEEQYFLPVLQVVKSPEKISKDFQINNFHFFIFITSQKKRNHKLKTTKTQLSRQLPQTTQKHKT